jgi:lysozyme
LGLALGLLLVVFFTAPKTASISTSQIIIQTAIPLSCPIQTPQPTLIPLTCKEPIVYAKHLSEQGFEFIRKYEELHQAKYLAPEGLCAVGYGHLTQPVGPCTSQSWPGYVSIEGAEQFLHIDVLTAEFALFKMDVNLSQTQLDSIVSLIFNMGEDNFKKTGIYKLLISGDFDKVPGEIKLTCGDINGTVWGGIIKRREAEALIFSDGIY